MQIAQRVWRICFLGTLITMFIVTLFGVLFADQTYKVKLTSDQVQKKLNDKLPLTIKNFTVKEAEVSFAENKIGVMLEATTTIINKDVGTRFFVSGELKREGESFYLTPHSVHIHNVSLEGIPIPLTPEQASTLDPKEEVSTIQKSRLEKWGGKKIASLAKKVAETKKEVVKKVNEAALDVSTLVLAAFPVYRFKDDIKGIVIRTTVTGMEFHEDYVTLSLSCWHLASSLVVALIILLVVLVILFNIKKPVD